MNGWVLPEGLLRDAPSYAPRTRELADLELLLSGALTPLTGFHSSADLDAITSHARLADGTPWPVKITLEVPATLVTSLDTTNPLKRVLVLTDPEGAPIAALDAIDIWPTRDGWCGIGGPVRRIGETTHGSFRRLRLSPEEVRAELPPGRVLGVIVDRPLHRPQLAQIAYAARTIAGHVLLVVPVATPGADGLAPEALVRTIFAARDRMPPATIVAVPMARRADDVADALLRSRVAEAYGATHLLAYGNEMSGSGPRALLPRELAYDGRDGQWRGADDIPPRHPRGGLSPREKNRPPPPRGPPPRGGTPPPRAPPPAP